MLLTHGTCASRLESIRQHGLRPRLYTGCKGNWEEYPSGEDRVYLTNCYSPYFAMMHPQPMIVVVDVDEETLYPDEDFLSQAMREVHRTGYYRDHIEEYKHYAANSLEHLGTVAHLGTITADRIVDCWAFEESILAVCDPQISLMNHAICGDYYRRLTNWFTGSDDHPESLYGGPPDERVARWFAYHAKYRKRLLEGATR